MDDDTPFISIELEPYRYTITCTTCGFVARNLVLREAHKIRKTHNCDEVGDSIQHKNIFENDERTASD